MRGTGSELQARRQLLRRRLMHLFDEEVAGTTTMELEIEELLEDILQDDLVPQPLPARNDDRDEDDRIVVTGMGLVTPLGIGIDAFWDGLRSGRSGVGPITLCDPGDAPSRIAAEVPGFEPREYLEAKEARRL